MNVDKCLLAAAALVTVACFGGCGGVPPTASVAKPTQAGPVATAPATPAPAGQPAQPAPTPAATQPPSPTSAPVGGAAGGATLSLTWFGQSTFVLTASTGLTALLDPAGAGTGYALPAVAGIDLVTVSHEHTDHNNAALGASSATVLRGLAGSDWAKVDQTVKGVRVWSLPTYHDDTQGSQRGKNAIFVFELPGLRLAHLGDLGHTLSAEQVKALGPLDVVLVPVGGFYTVDAKAAAEVVGQLNPRVAIPMHYRTPDVSASLAGRLAPVDDFATAMKGTATVVEASQKVSLEAGRLPIKLTVMVMKYK